MTLTTLFKKAGRVIQRRLRLTISTFRAWWIRRRGPIWYTDRHGITARLYPEDNLVSFFTHRTHFDDAGALAVLREVVRPGMVVLDVGAAKGAFTLYVGRLLGQTGHIHAFEPASYTFRRLQENVAQAGLGDIVTLNRAAVFKTDGQVTFNLFPPALSDWNTLGRPVMAEGQRRYSPTSSEVVEAVTLDTYCRRQDIAHIDLLKIDVEGFEVEALEGAAEMLRAGRIGSILFEISLAPLAALHRSAPDVLRAVAKQGFAISRITPGGELAAITDFDQAEIPPFANYLARPADAGRARR